MTSLLRAVDGGVPELNYLSREWVDPVISGILHLFGQGESVLLYVVLQHALSLVGLFLLFRARSMTRSESCWGAVGVQAAVTFVGGFNPILYKMQWYPFLLAWALKKRTERIAGQPVGMTFWGGARDLLLFAAWIGSSGGLSILGFLPLIVIVPAYTPFFLALSGVALWALPVFPLAGYPPDARLGPITPLDFEPAPLLGPKLSPNPLSYRALQETLWQCVLRLWIVGGLLSASAWIKSKRRLGFTLLALFFCLGAGAAAELLFPSRFSLTPVRVLYRIIPGAALHPLPWLVFPFLLPFLWLTAGRELFRATAISLIVMVVAFFVRGANSGGLSPVIQADAEIGRAWGLGAVPSPSQFVRSLYSEGALRAAQQPARLLVPGRDFQWTLSSSHRSQEIALAGDGDIKTAWSSGEPQQGGEWIEVEFDRPVAVVRIELAVGGWQSDFPRGVVVRAAETGGELFSQQNWCGALRSTPTAEPYLGPQAEVVLPLEQHPPVKKLRIEQVGRERFFNWSIAEIRVYTSSS